MTYIASTDDQQIELQGENVVLEDGGQLDGELVTDLAGNQIGVILTT